MFLIISLQLMNTYLIGDIINNTKIGGRDMKIIYIPFKFKFKRDALLI